MNQINCPICGKKCVKSGKTNAGSQRWLCKACKSSFTHKIDNNSKELKSFLEWLFGKEAQSTMPGEGRSFRRKTAKFWDIWTLPPVVEEKHSVVFVDGIYLCRNACVLICCDRNHVLVWYLCRYEHANAWISLMSRITEPALVVSDGGKGFNKALRKVWPHAKHQRCLFHVFSQVRRYTTSKPKTLAGAELYALAKRLLRLETRSEADKWVDEFLDWMRRHNKFLSQRSLDENGNWRATHERLLKAQSSLARLVKEGTLFTYLDEDLIAEIDKVPSTNNQIEGGINARLRALLRNHRGLSVERRIKAVFWWCYMHSPRPLSVSELLKVMPTDKSIAAIYQKISELDKRTSSIPTWGDAVVWGELHKSSEFQNYWD